MRVKGHHHQGTRQNIGYAIYHRLYFYIRSIIGKDRKKGIA